MHIHIYIIIFTHTCRSVSGIITLLAHMHIYICHDALAHNDTQSQVGLWRAADLGSWAGAAPAGARGQATAGPQPWGHAEGQRTLSPSALGSVQTLRALEGAALRGRGPRP